MARFVKARVEKLSLCDCGFPVLKNEILLGTEYIVDTERILRGGGLICGGCRRSIKCDLILAAPRGDQWRPGYIPAGVFEITDEVVDVNDVPKGTPLIVRTDLTNEQRLRFLSVVRTIAKNATSLAEDLESGKDEFLAMKFLYLGASIPALQEFAPIMSESVKRAIRVAGSNEKWADLKEMIDSL